MPTTPSPFKPEDYKDRTGTWRSPQGITVPIRVLDARRAYGRLELLITPINCGGGEAWVQAAYVTLGCPECEYEQRTGKPVPDGITHSCDNEK